MKIKASTWVTSLSLLPRQRQRRFHGAVYQAAGEKAISYHPIDAAF
ncbi:MAG: hypothetical protein ACTHLW_08905 [Verrucomicrobiota bacterium]